MGQEEQAGGNAQQGIPPCLGFLFKGDIESDVSNFFDRKKYFDQLSWERAQGMGHASPLDCNRGGHGAMATNHLS